MVILLLHKISVRAREKGSRCNLSFKFQFIISKPRWEKSEKESNSGGKPENGEGRIHLHVKFGLR